jgi:hypothetical protein
MATELSEKDFEANLRPLLPDEEVTYGDIIKDISAGEYCEVVKGSFHELMVGVSASHVRNWSGVSEIFRKK